MGLAGTHPPIFSLFKSVTAAKLPYLSWGRRSGLGDRLEVLGQLFGLAVERRVAAFHGDHLARHRLHHGALAGDAPFENERTLTALKNQLSAQSGKHIASSCTIGGVSFNTDATLLMDVQNLINSL